MTPAELRSWQTHMGYTPDVAAQKLGVHRATYFRWLDDKGHAGNPISDTVALACAALAAGLGPWSKATGGTNDKH